MELVGPPVIAHVSQCSRGGGRAGGTNSKSTLPTVYLSMEQTSFKVISGVAFNIMIYTYIL